MVASEVRTAAEVAVVATEGWMALVAVAVLVEVQMAGVIVVVLEVA